MNNDLQWEANIEGTDAIGTAGLLRRTRIMRNVSVTDETGPEVIGTIDISDQYSLTSITGFYQ
jgi:hypothetical protein